MQRAGGDTSPAVDAGVGPLGFLAHGVLGQHQDRRHGLGDRGVERGHAGAHHGAAENQLIGAAGESELLEHEAQRRAHRDQIIARFLDAWAGDGDHALDHALAARQQRPDVGQCGDVLYHHAGLIGKTAARDLPVQQRFDQQLLRALRVLGLHRLDADEPVARQSGADGRERIGLVVLDTDDRPLRAHRLHGDTGAGDERLRVFQHDAMVGRQEGFAFTAVHHHRVHGVLPRHGELDVGREPRAAQAHDAGVLHAFDDVLPRQCVEIARGAVEHLLVVAGIDPEHDGFGLGPLGAWHQVDGLDHARCRGVHGHGQKAVGPGDGFAPHHFLTGMHERHRRPAQVLGERNDHARGEGQPANGPALGDILVLGRVHPLGEAPFFQHF